MIVKVRQCDKCNKQQSEDFAFFALTVGISQYSAAKKVPVNLDGEFCSVNCLHAAFNDLINKNYMEGNSRY